MYIRYNILIILFFLDSKVAIQLFLLPALVPPRGRKKINNKKPWKPSISESRDSLMIHVRLPGAIEKAKESRVDIMFKKGLTVQPYILVIGPNLSNILNVLVIINNEEYKCDSVIDAIDFCFKAYQVLDAKYSYESQHIWYLIQWLVYKYHVKQDPQFPYLNEFL